MYHHHSRYPGEPLATRPPTLLILVLCLIVAASWNWWPVGPQVDPVDLGSGGGAGVNTSAAQELRAAHTAPGDQPAATDPQRHPTESLDGWHTVYGRRVDEDGQPVGDVSVSLDVDRSALEPRVRAASAAFVAPPAVVTSGDGKFTIRVRQIDWPLHLAAGTPYCSGRDSFSLTEDEFQHDWGDCLVVRGWPVRGRVVNHLNVPVEREWIAFGDSHIAAVRDGRFDLGSVSRNDYTPTFLLETCQVITPTVVHVGPEHDNTNLRIVVNEYPVVEGRVLDENDHPVPHWEFGVSIYPDGHVWAVCDARGRFRVATPEMGSVHARVESQNSNMEARPGYLEGCDWFPCPRRDLVLRFRNWSTFQLQVRGPDDQPVQPSMVLGLTFGVLRQIGPAEDGITTWTGLPPGPQFLSILSDRDRRASEWIPIDPALHREHPKTIRLPRLVPLRVTATCPEALAKQIQVRFMPLKPKSRSNPYPMAYIKSGGTAELFVPERIAEQGVFLRAGSATKRIVLDASDEASRHVSVEFEKPPARGTATLRAIYRDPLRPISRRRLARFLFARRKVGEPRPFDHHLRIQRLPAGDWEVFYKVDVAVWTSQGESRVRRPERVLGRINLGAGERAEIRIAIPELTPGRVRGTAQHLSWPLRDVEIVARSHDHLWSANTRTGADGSFDFGWLPKGTYDVRGVAIAVPGSNSTRQLNFAKPIEVEANGEEPFHLRTSERRITVQLRAPPGRSTAGLWLYVRSYGDVRADGAGAFVIDSAPPGAIHLTSRPEPGATDLEGLIPVGAKGVVQVSLRTVQR